MTDTLIAIPTLSDAASITASAETSACPVSHLKKIQPTDQWCSNSLTPYLVIDLLGIQSFNLVSLLFSNASWNCVWRIRTSDSLVNLTTTPTYDSGYVPFSVTSPQSTSRHGFMYRSAGWFNRFIRIDFNDSLNTVDNALYFGRLYVANGYLPSWPRSAGASFGFIDVSARDRTTRGNTIVNQQGVIPTAEFELNIPSESEFYSNTFKIQQLRAGSKDILVIFDPAAPSQDKVYYGLMNPTMRSTNADFRQFIQRYEIEGLI